MAYEKEDPSEENEFVHFEEEELGGDPEEVIEEETEEELVITERPGGSGAAQPPAAGKPAARKKAPAKKRPRPKSEEAGAQERRKRRPLPRRKRRRPPKNRPGAARSAERFSARKGRSIVVSSGAREFRRAFGLFVARSTVSLRSALSGGRFFFLDLLLFGRNFPRRRFFPCCFNPAHGE